MKPSIPVVVRKCAIVLLIIGLLTIFVSAATVLNCGDAGSSTPCSRKGESRALVLWHPRSSSQVHKWYGFSQAPDWYPTGDCATECSRNPATAMRSCAADRSLGIPSTSCKPLSDPDICPTLRYLDAVLPESYCMPRFEADCSHPDNIGCSTRCSLYVITNYHCVADAYDPATATFNSSCQYCNMCWDRSGSNTVGARKAPYVLLWARGETGALYAKHYLVLPKAACSGIESSAPGCTDKKGEYLWANAYHEATSLGFSYSHGPPNWALMLNAPNRRGVHQLHIHMAHFDTNRTSPGIRKSNWLVNKAAQHEDFSTTVRAPTRILGEGFYIPSQYNSSCLPLHRPPKDWARMYAVFVQTDNPARDIGTSIKPFDLGRQLAAASGEPMHGYGLMVMPRKFGTASGLIIGIVWSTDDWEQLDVSELQGDPIGYSHNCHNYIGTEDLLATTHHGQLPKG